MKDRIKECLAMANSYMQQSLVGAGHAKSLTRALSYINPANYFEDCVSGINYFDSLTSTLKAYDNKYDELVQNLKKLNEFMHKIDFLFIFRAYGNEICARCTVIVAIQTCWLAPY